MERKKRLKCLRPLTPVLSSILAFVISTKTCFAQSSEDSGLYKTVVKYMLDSSCCIKFTSNRSKVYKLNPNAKFRFKLYKGDDLDTYYKLMGSGGAFTNGLYDEELNIELEKLYDLSNKLNVNRKFITTASDDFEVSPAYKRGIYDLVFVCLFDSVNRLNWVLYFNFINRKLESVDKLIFSNGQR